MSSTDEAPEKDWGMMVGNRFVQLPKLPMLKGGYNNPPFDVTMPDGSIRHIIERPDDG
jgi:hypothetical protein